jgi:hypothetical protein
VEGPYAAPPEIARLQKTAFIIGTVVLAAMIVWGFFAPEQFFRSYLIGFLFWIGIALGSMLFLMLQHLTGGDWGLVIRRVCEAATRTLPLLAVLFLPVIVSLFLKSHPLYIWADPAAAREAFPEAAQKQILGAKGFYLQIWFFIVRAIIYFAAWFVLAYFLNKWSLEQDRAATGRRRLRDRMETLSGPGMVIVIFTITFASFDWVMSLDPLWSSTIFGLIFVGAWGLSALAFVIAVMARLVDRAPLAGVVSPRQFHDLGKLLLAMVMLWAYFSFSQYLIIWSGNLPEESGWYIYRTIGGWGVIAVSIPLLHFALPFVLLLSRDLKRNARTLSVVASAVLVMRVVDSFWLVEPAFHRYQFHLSVLDVLSPIGIGGIWLGYFSWQLQRRPLLPFNDPSFEEFLERSAARHALRPEPSAG